MNIDISGFYRILCENGLSRFCTEKDYASFSFLLSSLDVFGSHTNITAIKDADAVAVKHYADSLSVEPLIPRGARVADVGCGGGFPSLPLAMTREDIDLLSIDSSAKKLEFIKHVCAGLRLNNIEVCGRRAEDLGADPSYRERFDAVTARAVAALNILCELCLPLVRVGGIFLAMKGRDAAAELDAAKGAVTALGGRVKETVHVPLLLNGEEIEHNVIVIEKIKSTDKAYPRAYAKIIKKPL